MNNEFSAWAYRKLRVVEDFQTGRAHPDHVSRFQPIYTRACRPIRDSLGSSTVIFTWNSRGYGTMVLRTLFREEDFDAVW